MSEWIPIGLFRRWADAAFINGFGLGVIIGAAFGLIVSDLFLYGLLLVGNILTFWGYYRIRLARNVAEAEE